MNRIKECIENFILDKQQLNNEILNIERERNEIAQQRNMKKATMDMNNYDVSREVNELGWKIAELGNRSQELQNEINAKYINTKEYINSVIGELISDEAISQENRIQLEQAKKKVRSGEFSKILDILQEIENPCSIGNNETAQETENIEMVEESQDIAEVQACVKENDTQEIEQEQQEEQSNFEAIQEIQEESSEEISIDDLDQIEEFKVEEFEPVAELEIEEMEPIEELNIEEFNQQIKELEIQEIDPIEELEIAEFTPIEFEQEVQQSNGTEQIQVEEINEGEESIDLENLLDRYVQLIREEEMQKREPVLALAEEQKETEQVQEIAEINTGDAAVAQEENININEKVTMSNIIVKIENGRLLYKAQLSNGAEIKVYPCNENEGQILEKDKEKKNEIKESLINYALAEYRMFDKRVIKKIDPVVCDILTKFAKQYNYEAQSLVYSYAMSFSNMDAEIEAVPQITYNMYFTENSEMSKKEKEVLSKICRGARKNDKIEVIGYNSIISKIKCAIKKVLNTEKISALAEGTIKNG